METTAKKANELTSQELKALLAEREKAEKLEKKKAREDYESTRDDLIEMVMIKAKRMEAELKDFKSFVLNKLEGFRDMANNYGDIRSNSKGGFSLRHSLSQEMVRLDRNINTEYDERASQAEALLKDFLEDQVKKRDLATFRTITALLSRNKAGDFTPGQIGALLKIRDNYEDSRWQKAMQLFEESYRVRDISYSVSFFRKDTLGKDVAIILSMASLPVELEDIETKVKEDK